MYPINLLIKPASSSCNLRCKYCFYFDVADHRDIKNYGMMSLDTLEILVKKALDEASIYCSFAFQGGEPTLAGLDFFEKLIEYQKKYNYKNLNIYNAIQTNAYDLGEKWAEFFSKNNFLVGVSLDGTDDIHNYYRVTPESTGTYEKIMNTINYFNMYNVEYNILTVVTNKTAENIDKIYKFFSENNFKFLQFIPSIDSFDSNGTTYLNPQNYGIFLKKLFDLWYEDFINGKYISIRDFDNYINMLKGYPPENCAMKGRCEFYYLIESDGSVYPCDFYVLDKWKIGNIKTDSYFSIKNNPKVKEFEEMSYNIEDTCTECTFFRLCRNACRRYREKNLSLMDNSIGLNHFCESYKEFFSHSLDRMKKIAFT